MQLKVQRMEGFVREPEYQLAITGAGGRAERIDILGPSTSRVINGDYTSCRRDDAQKPDWVLSARQLDLDIDAGVGVAEGAVLRFLDVPILILPRLSFPLSDQRMSGWLPPTLDFTTGSGIELGVPYYWNIAPNRDATITPAISTRRGFAVDGEFRYLEPNYSGRLNLDLLPYDQVYEDTRYWLTFDHIGRLGDDARYSAHGRACVGRQMVERLPAPAPGLDAAAAAAGGAGREGLRLARARRRAVRAHPALAGAAGAEHDGGALRPRARSSGCAAAATCRPGCSTPSRPRPTASRCRRTRATAAPNTPSNGSRLHAQGWVNRPFREPGWWVTPSLLFNAASYYTDEPMPDGNTTASRVIPTFSLGGGAEFERNDRLARPLVAPDAGAAAAVREHALRQPVELPELRFGGQGLQLRDDLLRERVLRHRPRLRHQRS